MKRILAFVLTLLSVMMLRLCFCLSKKACNHDTPNLTDITARLDALCSSCFIKHENDEYAGAYCL